MLPKKKSNGFSYLFVAHVSFLDLFSRKCIKILCVLNKILEFSLSKLRTNLMLFILFLFSSVAGHLLPSHSNVSMYSASKWAVTALNEGLRKDLVASKSKIRNTVSSTLIDLNYILYQEHTDTLR